MENELPGDPERTGDPKNMSAHAEQIQNRRPSGSWRYFEQKPFLRSDRERTTLLFGGLTWKHERLLRGALRSLGYRSEIIPTPNVADFQTGKEYGNCGQCSPVVFTAGSLVNYLKRIEQETGLSKQDVVDRYVYLTPESPCGPCRLGMYQSEYRLVAENAGFHGFRIIPISQHPKLGGGEEAGFELNTDVSLALIFAILAGDLLNDCGYSIRPFELLPGETDRVIEASVTDLEDVISHLTFPDIEHMSRTGTLFSHWLPDRRPVIDTALRLHRWLFGAHLKTLFTGLRDAARRLDSISVDRMRVKPIVKVIGEFWDQMTEGDGNYQILHFLEKEGAEVLIEPVASWFHLTIHWARQHNIDYSTLIAKNEADITPIDRLRAYHRKRRNGLVIGAIDKAFARTYQKMRAALLNIPHPLVSQPLLEKIADPFYHSRLDAGEAHTEVGKNIYYHSNRIAHMVLSLKPFGCLPSTQSDAVQAAVQGAFGDMIYLPIETSGEGKVNALSRVQMALGEAKQRARQEFDLALAQTGLTCNSIHRVMEERPHLKKPSTRIPHHAGTVGTAANFVYHVGDLLHTQGSLE
jgi:predicted nucleotide-binding protein (sugar kinase/HSP70/actin superfamily)